MSNSFTNRINVIADGNFNSNKILRLTAESLGLIDPAGLPVSDALELFERLCISGDSVERMYKRLCHQNLIAFAAVIKACVNGVISETYLLHSIEIGGFPSPLGNGLCWRLCAIARRISPGFASPFCSESTR